jgi:hypothetical protein
VRRATQRRIKKESRDAAVEKTIDERGKEKK